MLDYAAFPEQRQALIYQILQENGRVICSELASRLGVSEHTIRRDLHELSKDGVCKKVYGGAVIALPESEDITVRKSINVAKKSNIAQRCARMVKSGSCIFIDTGSTNLAMAEALPAELALTVVTNSPEIAAVLLKNHCLMSLCWAARCNDLLEGAWVPPLSRRCRAFYSIRVLLAAARCRLNPA